MSDEHHHGPPPAAVVHRDKFGMWLFLASEVMFFTGFIAAYIVLRNAHAGTDGDPFLLANRHLSVPLAATNTLALILSSFTMALAVGASQKGDKGKTQLFLLATSALACVFLVIKYIEYSTKFHHGYTPDKNVFFAMYFLLTGFHGLHVVGGIITIAILVFVNAKGKFSAEYNTPIEVTGLYWHLVDIVWIFLFPMLYLLQ